MGTTTLYPIGYGRSAPAVYEALRVLDLDEAVDPARNDWVEAAFAFSAQHRGAAKRVVAEVLAVLARVPR
jgi:hypothetical protein